MTRKTFIIFLMVATACGRVMVVWADNGFPEQKFLPYDGINEDYIATDPSTGKKLYLGSVSGFVGQPIVVKGWIRDKDGHALTLTRSDTNAQVPIDPNDGTFSLTVRFATPGTKFLTLTGADTNERKGTVVAYVNSNNVPVMELITD